MNETTRILGADRRLLIYEGNQTSILSLAEKCGYVKASDGTHLPASVLEQYERGERQIVEIRHIPALCQ